MFDFVQHGFPDEWVGEETVKPDEGVGWGKMEELGRHDQGKGGRGESAGEGGRWSRK